MISKIEVYRHVLHFKEPAKTSRDTLLNRNVWYIVVTLDNGLYAVGECAPLMGLSFDSMRKIEYENILNGYIQKHAIEFNLDSFQDKASTPEYTYLAQYPSMLFGLESAFIALRAKANHQNMAFYDTDFAHGKQGITINGLIWMGNYEQMFKRIQSKLEQKFKCVKLKIGGIDFNQELELLRLIRQDFSSDVIELRLDANGAFTKENALERLDALAKFDIHSIEQPVKAGQVPLMHDLCRQSPIAIALDEELISHTNSQEREQLIEQIMPQYIILKPSLHGGLIGTQEWIKAAQDRQIKYWMTSALESNIGLYMIAQFAAFTHNPMPQGLGTGQLFTNNIDYPLSLRGDQLFVDASLAQHDIDFYAYMQQNQSPCILSTKL